MKAILLKEIDSGYQVVDRLEIPTTMTIKRPVRTAPSVAVSMSEVTQNTLPKVEVWECKAAPLEIDGLAFFTLSHIE